jgi:fructose-1,6-bisphosphatase I
MRSDSSLLQKQSRPSLSEYLETRKRSNTGGTDDNDEDEYHLVLNGIVLAVADSCVEISKELRRLPFLLADQDNDLDHMDELNATLPTEVTSESSNINVQGEIQKPMDIIANEMFLKNVRPLVATMISEEEESVIVGNLMSPKTSSFSPSFHVAFDPLDGSNNLDVNMPTGSIFGIYMERRQETKQQHEDDGSYSNDTTPIDTKSGFWLGSPTRSTLVAAGYAVYSSSTEMILSFGDNVVGFTLLDDDEGDGVEIFRLTRPSIVCPDRGPYYSLNEAREPDWPVGLQRWVYDAKRGLTPYKRTYSSRYVCSLCADFHRTLLQGGWAGNPRPHLRLLYEAAPLAFVVEAAGGRGSDGENNLLDICPKGLHARTCVFLGGKADIEDLESYGDIQQGGKQYSA